MVRLVDSIVDETQKDLQEIESTGTHGDAKLLADLKKRTLVDKQYESQFIFCLLYTMFKLRELKNFICFLF